MKIDEAIETIEGERWICCHEKYVEAMNLMTNTMHKYQKIENIINNRYGIPVFETLEDIIEVVEDGNNKIGSYKTNE